MSNTLKSTHCDYSPKTKTVLISQTKVHKEYFLFEKTWDDVFVISMLSLVYLWEVVFGVFNHIGSNAGSLLLERNN